jgi:hypothetical protein
MNKSKIFSYLFIGLLATGAMGTVTSCKDYDDDISNLQKQIDDNAAKIKTIEDLIKSGSVITDVTSSTDGVTVKLSNGKSFDLKNGAKGDKGDKGDAGTPGTAWTIGTDGYWYKSTDGGKTTTKTDYYALGTKGDKGDKGDAASVEYYVPNAETHHFDIYKDGKFVKDSGISFANTDNGTVTGTLDTNAKNLIISGLQGYSEDVVISLTGDLRSLVFMPKLYLDGIETINYPYLTGTTLVKKTPTGIKNHQGKAVGGDITDYQSNKLPNDPISVTGEGSFVYGPTWTAQFHMNPANADVKYADVVGYNVLEPEVQYVKTRAAAEALGVTSPEKKDNGDAAFLADNGILTAGIKIAHPELLNANPTSSTYQKDNTVALQVKSKSNNTEATITSDYALLNPLQAKLEALVWAQKPMYGEMDAAKRTQTGDEKGIVDKDAQIHVWDSPKEALADERGAALELYYNGEIDLKSYLALHMQEQDYTKLDKAFVLKTLTLDEAREWGLSYEFNLVDYNVDGNKTGDSKYATWKDQANGVLKANNVDENGNPAKDNRAAIGREPLVQVLVKNANGDVVLDGYILLHITEKAPEDKITELTAYPDGKGEFDLCNAVDGLSTNWSQFNKYMLTDLLNGTTKQEFDAMYSPEVLQPGVDHDAQGNPIDKLKLYKKNADGTYTEDELGDLFYSANTEGTTNHTWKWTLSPAEVEELTHHAKTTPVVATRYFRYVLKQAVVGTKIAEYKYIYVKVTTDLTRKANTAIALKEKINNYWYNETTGADDGWSAIVNDVHEPINGGNIDNFNNSIAATFKGNAPQITNTYKYYFVPEDIEITAQNGKKYTITAGDAARHTNGAYNHLYDKYVANHTDAYNKATLTETLNTCAIDYDKGAFWNKELYAEYNGNYTKIATLDQKTGELKLINNQPAKDVLNAIGYEKDHANIAKELRTYVGVIASNDCGVAVPVSDGTFLASWQRPINLNPLEQREAVDAKTNGNVIYLSDIVKLFDWRGVSMEGENKWFWAYYGVNAITVNVDPAVVLTDMHHEGKFEALKNVTELAELYTYGENGTINKGSHKFTFDLSTYNSASKNADLLKYIEEHKGVFGAIFYKNNGENVTDFTLKIPVTISYTWGDFYDTLVVKVVRTQGN